MFRHLGTTHDGDFTAPPSCALICDAKNWLPTSLAYKARDLLDVDGGQFAGIWHEVLVRQIPMVAVSRACGQIRPRS